MRRSTIIIHARPWWQTRRGVIAALASAGVSCGIWWLAAGPADDTSPVVPLEVEPTRSTISMAAALAPAAAPLPAQSPAMPAPPPSLSTMVAPGVHITPLSVPPGAVVMPAGPGPDDSEPEN